MPDRSRAETWTNTSFPPCGVGAAKLLSKYPGGVPYRARTSKKSAHFTGAHASRLTLRTKLWRLFQAIRVLVV
jgi:hypothetical protein